MFRTLCTVGCLLVALPAWAQDGKGYYRFPTIHGETIVFAAKGTSGACRSQADARNG